MAVQTVNGAEIPSTPTGAGGVRGYRATGSTRISRAASGVRDADGVRETLNQSMDLVSAILTVVIAGAAAYAGINVMSNIASTMALSDGGPNSSADTFYNASQALGNGVDSFFTQLPTVFVVIALVLIISYLTVLRGR